jgi:flagellar motor switch protein FliM
VVAIGAEICVGSCTGTMNMAIPSLLIKMVRQRFDQQWVMRRSDTSPEDQLRMLQLVGPSHANVEVYLEAPPTALHELLQLDAGDLLMLDVPVSRPLECMVNGEKKLQGHMAQTGRRCVFVVDECVEGGGA